MARISADDHSAAAGDSGLHHSSIIQEPGLTTAQNIVISPMGLSEVPVPGAGFISNAVMTQEGSDLILETPDGITMVIEGYFSADTPPNLISTDGKVLTPALVKSFIQASTDFAEDKTAMNDATPVGEVHEVTGSASVTRTDGTKEVISKGTHIFEGDVIETDAKGAVNIQFADESSFAVSNNAKMAIDEFVFDTTTNGGENKFSVLRGLFVYTSGLVGREDPDDVKISTPVGTIGIRGTIITGDIPAEGEARPATISVVEGAIVVDAVTGTQTVLSQQFETVQIDTQAGTSTNIGVLPQSQISETFNVMRTVAPTLFSTIEEGQPPVEGQPVDGTAVEGAPAEVPVEEAPVEEQKPEPQQNDIRLNLMNDRLDPTLDDKTRTLAADTGLEKLVMPMAGGETMRIGAMPVAPQPPAGTAPQDNYDPGRDNGGNNEGGGGEEGIAPNLAPISHIPNYTAFEQAALEFQTHTFDLSRFFSDPDGDALTYNVVFGTVPAGTSGSVDANGLLTITIGDVITTDGTPMYFNVTVSDGSLSSTAMNVTMFSYKINTGIDGTTGDDGGISPLEPSGANQVIAAYDGNDIIDANIDGTKVFGGAGDDIMYVTSVDNNKLYGDEGNDNISINGGTNNLISGGAGDDTLAVNLNSASELFNAYGGTGKDIFILNNMDSVGALLGLKGLIDGGTDFDTVMFASSATGSSFNLYDIPVNKVMGIEKFDFNSSTTDVCLYLSDILRMGGEDKTLYISVTGSGNAINVIDDGAPDPSLVFVSGGHTDPNGGGETYDMYSNGDLTLFISDNSGPVDGTGIIV